MFFKQFYNKKLSHYSYLIGCENTKEALLIDPLRLLKDYEKTSQEEGLTIIAVTETHIHADYASGLRDAADYFEATAYVSDEGDDTWKYKNMPDATVYLKDGDMLMVGEQILLKVISTPGHTPESLSFVLTDKGVKSVVPIGIFTGDFLFVSDVGRPDLLKKTSPEDLTSQAAAQDMYESIQKMGDYRCFMQIWPGHGAGSPCGKAIGSVPISTLGYERRNNWALKLKDKDKFIKELLDGQAEPPTHFAHMKKINQEGLLLPFHVRNIPLAREKDSSEQIFDLRPRQEFATGFIKEAINIPYNEKFLKFMGWFIDYDKPMTLIANPDEMESIQKDLALIGYDKVAFMIPANQVDAYLNASYEEIEAADFLDLLDVKEDLQVLDVRDQTEWERGHLPEALNIHFGLLEKAEVDLDPDKPVYMHCQSGVRSAIAASVLSSRGYKDLYNIEGGYAAIEKELEKRKER